MCQIRPEFLSLSKGIIKPGNHMTYKECRRRTVGGVFEKKDVERKTMERAIGTKWIRLSTVEFRNYERM
jgi:hypothetical protein